MNRYAILLFLATTLVGSANAQSGPDASMPQSLPARAEQSIPYPDRDIRNTIQVPQNSAPVATYNNVPERNNALASGRGMEMNGDAHRSARALAAPDGTIYVQDRGLREARYNSVFSPTTRNAFINPGFGTVETRYNTTFRRYFYYCSSPFSRKECDSLCYKEGENVAENNLRDRLMAGMCTECTGLMYNSRYTPCAYHRHRDAQIMPDKTTRYSNSAQYFSFDGTVVRGSDTIAGIVTIICNGVSVEHGIITNRRTSSWALSDTALKSIVVYKGIRKLQLVRLHATDKHLSRVVHSGLLNVYDRSYQFVTPDNVRKKLLIQSAVTGEAAEINGTKALVAAINKAYGLSLKEEEETRSGLVTCLNRLD